MRDMVAQARSELAKVTTGTRPRTAAVRAVAAAMFRVLEDKSIDHVLAACEPLLEERQGPLWVIAYDWAYRVRKQYNDKTFAVFERWLMAYVTDWDDCDDFCTHAFGALISQNNELFARVKSWTTHPNFAVRRAAPVVLINPIKQGKYTGIDPYAIADLLMNDDHYLVLKGYGWMLKVLSQVEPQAVAEYLSKHKRKMPRLAFRYAIEKMDKDLRANLFN